MDSNAKKGTRHVGPQTQKKGKPGAKHAKKGKDK